MNKSSLGYEQLDNRLELEIFGIDFRLDVSEEYFRRLKDIKINEENEEALKVCIDELLGNEAYNRIKTKYENDLGKPIDNFIWLKVVYFMYDELEKYIQRMQIKKRDNKKDNYRRRNYRRY